MKVIFRSKIECIDCLEKFDTDFLATLVLFQGIFILGDPSFYTLIEKVWHLLLGSCVIIEEILGIYQLSLIKKGEGTRQKISYS